MLANHTNELFLTTEYCWKRSVRSSEPVAGDKIFIMPYDSVKGRLQSREYYYIS